MDNEDEEEIFQNDDLGIVWYWIIPKSALTGEYWEEEAERVNRGILRKRLSGEKRPNPDRTITDEINSANELNETKKKIRKIKSINKKGQISING